MTMRTRLAAGTVVAILLAVIVSACGASATQTRRKAMDVALVTLQTSGKAFSEWDQHRQEELVRAAISKDEGAALLAAYRLKRAPVLRAFDLAYSALGLAVVLDSDTGAMTKAIAAAIAADEAWRALKGAP